MSIKSSFSPQLEHLFKERFQDRVRFNEPLAPLLHYQVGGPADILVFPKDEPDLLWIADTAKEKKVPIFVIGLGTNLLVRDEGIRGITVSLRHAFQNISIIEDNSTKGSVLVQCGGAVEKPQLLEWAVENDLAGMEFCAGIPGTVGGGIYMNAGTKYGCFADILREVCLFDFESGIDRVRPDGSDFGYRRQSLLKKKALVTSVTLELSRGNRQRIRLEVDRIIKERAEKQPLELPSCGSTFKNPPGHSAGRLIERSGLKGLRVGGAQISTKHANFILNRGNATASDILELIDTIKSRVKAKFNIQLECEVIVVGGEHAQQKI